MSTSRKLSLATSKIRTTLVAKVYLLEETCEQSDQARSPRGSENIITVGAKAEGIKPSHIPTMIFQTGYVHSCQSCSSNDFLNMDLISDSHCPGIFWSAVFCPLRIPSGVVHAPSSSVGWNKDRPASSLFHRTSFAQKKLTVTPFPLLFG